MWGIFSGDPIAIYLSEACSVAPLTEEEEARLSEVLRARDSSLEPARLRLVEGNLRLAVSIARRHAGAGVDVLDLIRTGNDALLGALDTFGASSYDRFSGHATVCVELAILASL